MNQRASESHVEAIERLARAIVRYVNAHPDASDTIEGVARWWVASEAEHVTVDLLERALDMLTERRVLTVRVLPDGRQVFRRSR